METISKNKKKRIWQIWQRRSTRLFLPLFVTHFAIETEERRKRTKLHTVEVNEKNEKKMIQTNVIYRFLPGKR